MTIEKFPFYFYLLQAAINPRLQYDKIQFINVHKSCKINTVNKILSTNFGMSLLMNGI